MGEMVFRKGTNKASGVNEKERAIQPFRSLNWETRRVVKPPASFL